MATPTAALLAAFNGKPSNSPGNNYGGYNPFGTSSNANSTSNGIDPGAQAQNDVTQSQANYQGQQNDARSQLQAALSPASVGGGAGISSQQTGNGNGSQNSDPFSNFNSQISAIQQRGIDATSQVQQDAQTAWNGKLSNLAQQYQTNMANPATWNDQQIQSMLQGMPGYQTSPDYSSLVANLPAGTDPNSIGARAIAIAKQSLGVPYVYGGNSLTQGVDCSGLVQQVYERLGIQLPRTSTEQAKAGKVVSSLAQALPGDLILMYSPYEPAGLQQYGHVGLYIGNGMMLDAPHTGAVVRIEPIVNMTGIVRPW